MKYIVVCIFIASLLIAYVPLSWAQGPHGAKIDRVRFIVTKSPDAALLAMKTKTVEMLLGLIRTGDIEDLDGLGYTITSALGFHMGHIGLNIRSAGIVTDPAYGGYGRYRAAIHKEVTFWPLADVEFRHALLHAYNQKEIVVTIYKYIVTAVRSLVPPAIAEYYNDLVMEHPYNPGDPFTSPAGEHSSCGILKAAGYTFDDRGTIGVVDEADRWKDPLGGLIPDINMYTPTYEVAPTSAEHGASLVRSLREIGLAGTLANENHGFIHQPAEFWPYLIEVFQNARFDAYMVFWGLGRFPDHLYDMCHSSQISGPPPAGVAPWLYNAPGINHSSIDALTETVKFSMDHPAKVQAAKDVQELLYDPDAPGADKFALAYIQLYSRTLFNAYDPDMEGIVNSEGYGADNSWTYLNMRWKQGKERYDVAHPTETLIKINLDEEPERLNVLYASTVYAARIIGMTLDGLLAVNPFTHQDIPWLCSSWDPSTDIDHPWTGTTPNTGVPITDGMVVTYHLRSGLKWQDGHDYDAYDAKFSWEFLRDWEIPLYTSTWKFITDVEVIDPVTVKLYSNVTSQFLPIDFAGVGALLPPQVWDRDWNNWPDAGAENLTNILGYDPADEIVGYDLAPGYSDGPTPTPTNLFGTGPFIFESYDELNMICEMYADNPYFLTTAEIDEIMATMFWAGGDVDGRPDIAGEPTNTQDGVVEDPQWVFNRDYYRYDWSFGYDSTEQLGPGKDPAIKDFDVYADLTEDGLVDHFDGATITYHMNDHMTYP